MRKRITMAAFALAISATSCLLGVTKEPSYSSEKPLYAFVVLNDKGTKVLKLVFDESQGTGKAYDTVYADLNLNGDLTDDKAIKAKLERQGEDVVRCSFPDIDVDVPYNERGKGIEKPWQITIRYYQFTMRGRDKEAPTQIDRSFYPTAKIRLADDTGEWQYSFQTELHPAEKPKGALAADFGGKPILIVTTKPDKDKNGNTGIAADFMAGGTYFQCRKDNQPVTAHVQIKNDQGKVIHSEDVASDKLVFG